MISRIPYYTKIFFLSPKIFFKKGIARILLKVIPVPKGVVQTSIGGYTIDTLPSRNDWWESMYLRCLDIEITHNIKRYLTIGGIFIDVGGGVGYFSAIASNIVGVSGQVHCFEAYPSNVRAIQRMIESNPNSNIILNDCALGADEGINNLYTMRFRRHSAISMIGSLIERIDETIEVRTQRLDTYLRQNNIDEVSLIKIDVEGYEFYVLKGLSGFFEKVTHRPPIICEIFVPLYKKIGHSLSEFHTYMGDYGYQAHNIFNARKRIDIRMLRETTDVIFIQAK